MGDWGNPLKRKQPKPEKEPKPKKEEELPLFKKEKLTLPKSEAKKVLGVSGSVSQLEVAWVQRWLDQTIRERSYPPQLSGDDAYGLICAFLTPSDSLQLLKQIREDYEKQKTSETPPPNPFGFLDGLSESPPFP